MVTAGLGVGGQSASTITYIGPTISQHRVSLDSPLFLYLYLRSSMDGVKDLDPPLVTVLFSSIVQSNTMLNLA